MRQIELEYEKWLAYPLEDTELITELVGIADDDEAVNERFYRRLEFGTGGLRGLLGAGINRMNIYTVRQATHGLAHFLQKRAAVPFVAIAYDSRIKSELFACEAARVLAFYGIRVHIFSELMPTPALSFAVRELGCDAGVIITASHNPAEYNGYKVYGSDGCQITLQAATDIFNEIVNTEVFSPCGDETFDELLARGMILRISETVIQSYLSAVQKLSLSPISSDCKLKVVYTPLNGSGLRCVADIFARIGIGDVTVVASQSKPDGRFPTCPYPNPEEKSALKEGIALCSQIGADLLLATDPDCDRVGVAVRVPYGSYEIISGNELGAMLLEYICIRRLQAGHMPVSPVAIKTIVTTALAEKIAKKYHVQLLNVLTGFKFIGEQIGKLEREGRADSFIFGFEESCGYLAGSYVRDKDGVAAVMLISEMAEYYRSNGSTLLEVRERMYFEYGYYAHRLSSFTFDGAQGNAHIKRLMCRLRNAPAELIEGEAVGAVRDYLVSVKGSELPAADVLQLDLNDGSQIIIRPSGTEPKIKIYTTAIGENCALAQARCNGLCAAAESYVKQLR